MDLIRRKVIQQSLLLCRLSTTRLSTRNFGAFSKLSHETNTSHAFLQQIPSRNFAMAKGSGKKDSKTKSKVEINEEFLKTHVDYDKTIKSMQKSLDVMKEEYIKQLSLRSTTGAIESLLVKIDGKDHELQEIAQIVRNNPKTIVINMINFPQTIPDVLLAIQKSGMNLNPQQDGTTLFIPVPKVTKEHRESLAKNAKQLFIKCRDSIKSTQNAAIKTMGKKKKISEDEGKRCSAQLGALGEQYIAQAQKLLDAKQNELIGKD